MTRGDLKTKFTALFNRRDLTANTALVDTFIDQAIMRVQRDLRIPAMEKMIDVTIGTTYTGLVIPDDLLELKEIRPQATNKKLVKRNLDAALAASTYAGTPQIYARQGGSWILGPTPAAGDVIRVTYYAEMSPLNADADENIISIIAWDLLLQAALVNAAQFFVDKRKDDFEGSYQVILQALTDQADEDSMGDDAAVEPGLTYPAEDVDGLYECV